MNLEAWEVTIQQMVAEAIHEPKRRHKLLTAWRAKLEKEPISLSLHQIDEIVREVRKRLIVASR
jgi:hypothetical protein